MFSRTSLSDVLKQIKPQSLVARLTAYAAVVYVLLRLAGWLSGRVIFGTRLVAVLLSLGLVVLAFGLLWRLRKIVLWRLRNRLLVTYGFIAVVPVVLILAIVVLAGYLMFGQLGAYLLISDLQAKSHEVDAANRMLLSSLAAKVRAGERLSEALRDVMPGDLTELLPGVPKLEAKALLGREGYSIQDGKTLRRVTDSFPQWSRTGFSGLVREGEALYFCSVRPASVPQGTLTLRLSAPLNDEVFSNLRHEVGPAQLQPTVEVPAPVPGGTTLSLAGRRFILAGVVATARVPLPPAVNGLDVDLRGYSKFDVFEWLPGDEAKTIPVFIYFTSRPSVVMAELFSTLGEIRSIPLVILFAAGIVFLLMEVLALVAGVILTRSVTKAVAGLYKGTQQVQVGDFSYRIKTASKDQLGVLGESFNTMTESIARLIVEVREKQKLEGEVEIAQQVQAQLFPREVPRVGSLDLAGACRAARGVSGDYYDYFRIGEGQLGLAIGDISGKGISSALLMATIQAAWRSYLRKDSAAAPGVDTARLTERLNRQLFESTSPEKYATFCCAVFDSATGLLTYTNAGHLPPLYCADGKIERLEAGGTVVGLFEQASYQQATLQMKPGSLLVAYTDGITECENAYGEAFGDDLLAAIVRRQGGKPAQAVIAEIMRRVDEWTAGAEQDDDMTLLVVRMY
jgi:sigma-B regulation protein RsbU (phosphoserine phosphatase)